jgi:Mechanosensitive ion channel
MASAGCSDVGSKSPSWCCWQIWRGYGGELLLTATLLCAGHASTGSPVERTLGSRNPAGDLVSLVTQGRADRHRRGPHFVVLARHQHRAASGWCGRHWRRDRLRHTDPRARYCLRHFLLGRGRVSASANTSSSGQIRGTVESISLRFLRLRHHRGAIHTIPFGEIRWLTNQSRDWQIMKLEFRVPFDADIRLAKSPVRQIGEELMQDAELGPWLLEPVKSRGVIRMEEFCMVIGVKFTTRPGDGQFMLRREAYHRILEAFSANGIRFSDRHVRVEMIGDTPEESSLPALAGGAAERPIEPPLALASSEKGSGR